jgi:hypothetical protein
MAEGYATGAMGMGRYMQFNQPAGFETLVRYTRFRRECDTLYDDAEPFADVALVLPRQTVQHRHPGAQRAFGELGQALVEQQVLMDVVVDQNLRPGSLDRYSAVVLVYAMALSDEQLALLAEYVGGGRKVFVVGPLGMMDGDGRPRGERKALPGAVAVTHESSGAAARVISEGLQKDGASVIEAPWTVRVAAYTHPRRVMLHLVNYDREEGAPHNNRTGADTERPEAVENVTVDLRLPAGRRATAVTLCAPDREAPLTLPFRAANGRVTFTVPRLFVYGIAEIGTETVKE